MQDLISEVVVERPRLQNAPLKAVICQVRFPQILDLGDSEVRPVQRALSDRYPLMQRELAEELAIEAAPTPEAILRKTGTTQRIYRFQSREQDWAATVGPEAISLETTAYVGMLDFLTRWAELIEVAKETLALGAQHRLGLRYINDVPCPGDGRREDLDGWVRGELIGLIGAHEARTSNVIRSLTEARLRQPDGCTCTVRYGVATGVEDPDSKRFLLDLDYYDDETHDFALEAQVRALAAFNDGTYELFQWAFPEDTRATFGPELPPGGASNG